VTQSRFNTAGRLAAATAILVGGGLSIANPVNGTVTASAAGVTGSPALVTATRPLEMGGGHDPHGAKGHYHGSDSGRGQGGAQREKGHRGPKHEGMNHDGMGSEGMSRMRMGHEGMDRGNSPDRETHRQKSH
jgi:hypothetical protein